jgi:malonyl-CoA/methylmalonyl-CoA synthetase
MSTLATIRARGHVRWGIIGCGDVTEVKSGPAFRRVKGSSVSACMRRDAGEGARLRRTPRHRALEHRRGAVIEADDVDAVYVATPPSSHLHYVRRAAAAGKPVYVEKPMALDRAEGEAMVAACEAAGVPLFVAYYRRAQPRFEFVRARLHDGSIGEPTLVQCELHQPPPAGPDRAGWRWDPAVGGDGLLLDLGSHGLDLLDHWLGPIAEVRGFASSRLPWSSGSPTRSWARSASRAASTASPPGASRARPGGTGSRSWAARGASAVPLFADGPVRLTDRARRDGRARDPAARARPGAPDRVDRRELLGRGGPCPSTGVERPADAGRPRRPARTADRVTAVERAQGAPRRAAAMTPATLPLALARAAADHGERRLLHFEGVDWSYADVAAEVRAVAGALAAWGVAPGDRVALYLDNTPSFLVAYLAALWCGAAVVPANTRYRDGELAHMLRDAEACLAVTDLPGAATMARVRAEVPTLTSVVELHGDPRTDAGRWRSLAGAPPLEDPRGSDGAALALLLYTSGTTGRSKGAALSHDNLLATVSGLLAAWAWEPGDVLLLTLPLFHTHGLVVGLDTALAAGATVVLHPRFDADAVVARLAGGEPTLFFGVPTMYVRLVHALGAAASPPDLSAMRLFCSGSAPLAPETFAAFRDLTGHAILERYGMTETGMNLSNPYAGERRPGTVGTPLPGVAVRIVDAAGDAVEAGGEGELLVRGSNVFAGYWRDPEATRAAFVTDGEGERWFRTGDLARRDPANGVYTLLGRRSELILSGGFNVYPREVEEVIATLAEVQDVAVVGLADDDLGERVVAAVVGEAVDPAAVVAVCRRHLAGFKAPREVVVVPSLPRNAMGKVLRHELRDALERRAPGTAERSP